MSSELTKILQFNQSGHERCRHRLDMGDKRPPSQQVNILVKFFLKAI